MVSCYLQFPFLEFKCPGQLCYRNVTQAKKKKLFKLHAVLSRMIKPHTIMLHLNQDMSQTFL